MNLMTISPFLKLLLKTASYFVDTVPYPDPKLDDSPAGRDNIPLKTIFQNNVSTIAAINKSRNIKTIFVGQMLNRENLSKPEAGRAPPAILGAAQGWNVFMPFLSKSDTWKTQAEFNDLLKSNAAKAGYAYIDPDIYQIRRLGFCRQRSLFRAGCGEICFADLGGGSARMSDFVGRSCVAQPGKQSAGQTG